LYVSHDAAPFENQEVIGEVKIARRYRA